MVTLITRFGVAVLQLPIPSLGGHCERCGEFIDLIAEHACRAQFRRGPQPREETRPAQQ